jgi:hypothetical protein
MNQEASNADLTLALNTALEREFVTPLTSIRGALEIMRDFPDLSEQEHGRFLENALQDCARLELGIEQLASTVYATGNREHQEQPPTEQVAGEPEYSDRIHFYKDLQIIEVDFSEFEFSSSKIVNDFYNLLDRLIEATGVRWYILVNYRKCTIWPDAWIAFAHRGKKVNVSYSLGTMRYVEASEADEDTTLFSGDPDLFDSRVEALAHIDALRPTKPAR